MPLCCDLLEIYLQSLLEKYTQWVTSLQNPESLRISQHSLGLISCTGLPAFLQALQDAVFLLETSSPDSVCKIHSLTTLALAPAGKLHIT